MKQLTTCLIVGCQSTCENEDLGLCATHAHELRKMERDKEKAHKKRLRLIEKNHVRIFSTAKKPIPKISEKMAAALREYGPKKKKFLEDNPLCRVCCTERSVDVHHMQGRNTIELLLDETKWLPVCDPCHKFITENSKFAIENGYSLLRSVK